MGWGYFPDYDEVGTVGKAAHHSRLLCNNCGAVGFRSAASMASDVAQDELRERLQEDFEPKKFKQLQDLVRRMKRKTRRVLDKRATGARFGAKALDAGPRRAGRMASAR